MPTCLSRTLTVMLLLVFVTSMPIYSEMSNDFVSSLDYIEDGLLSLRREIKNLQTYIGILERQIAEVSNDLMTSEELLDRSQQRLEQQRTLLNRLYRQLDESERQLQEKTQEYNRRVAKITEDHQAEVQSLERQVLLWKIVAGVFGAAAVGAATYGILK